MFNAKLQQLKDRFGLFEPEDWQTVEPGWILRLDGFGPKILDYLRLLLAQRGLTLKGDKTPEYWQQHLKDIKIVDQLGDEEDGSDRGAICPFTIYVDPAEQQPFTFQGFHTDAAEGNRPLIVPTEPRALGRHPVGLGDYSLDCGLGRCHVERKSMADAHGTILGFTANGDGVSRRQRFEQELENLSELAAGLVVVECTFADAIRLAPETGHRSAAQNAKVLYRSLIAYQQDYGVKWIFADGRRLAEQVTFRWLERFARKQREAQKDHEKELRRLAAPVKVAAAVPAMAELF
jgi:hypothetical protein